MELSKIHELNETELKAQEAQTGEQLFRIRFEKSLGNTEGIRKLRELKKDIARMKTVTRQRQLGHSAPEQAAPIKARKAKKA